MELGLCQLPMKWYVEVVEEVAAKIALRILLFTSSKNYFQEFANTKILPRAGSVENRGGGGNINPHRCFCRREQARGFFRNARHSKVLLDKGGIQRSQNLCNIRGGKSDPRVQQTDGRAVIYWKKRQVEADNGNEELSWIFGGQISPSRVPGHSNINPGGGQSGKSRSGSHIYRHKKKLGVCNHRSRYSWDQPGYKTDYNRQRLYLMILRVIYIHTETRMSISCYFRSFNWVCNLFMKLYLLFIGN